MATVYSQLYANNRIKDAERKQQVELNEQLRQQEREKIEEENVSFWERLGTTIADVFTELGGGLLKLVEGVVDIGVGIAGGVGSIFGADTQWAEDIIKFDATQEWYYGAFEDEFTKHSYINDAPIVKDVVRGIGQQLPTIVAVAAAPFTSGASLAALPYTVGATIASAGGGGMEEALNDDADFGEALLYGVLQSGIEGAVEFATAGMGKGITSIGKAVGKSTIKTVAKSTGKVMLEEGLSEFVEEGLSALLNPLTKTTYKGAEALETYKDMTFYLDAAQQALVGGIVGGITGGATAVGKVRTYGGKSSYSIAQSATELSTLETKEANLYKNGKLTEKNMAEIDSQRQAEFRNISEQLKSMNEADRKAAIEKFELSELFSENGDVLATSEQTLAQEGNEANKPLISGNINAVSPSMRNKPLLFQPTANELSESSIKAKKFVMSLDPNAKTIFTDSLPKGVKAFYDTNSKAMYISNNISTDALMGHELTHSLEGTKEFTELKSYVIDNLKATMGEDAYNKLVAQKIQDYKNVNKESKKGKNGKVVALYEAETEIVADEMGKLLSDPASVNRIVRQNSYKKAYRIWQWIKDTLAKLTKRGEKGEYYQYIRNAEKLYADAIRSSVGGISLSQVRSNVDAIAEFERLAKKEIKESVANEENKRYNLSSKELWNKLSKKEQAIFYSKIDETHHQGYATTRLKNGDVVYDVENKIIISDGDFDYPSIESIVEFSKFSNQISKARDYIYENLNNGGTIREVIDYCNTVLQEEVATLYQYGDSEVNSKLSGQADNNQQDRKSSGNNKQRTRVSRKTDGSLRYSIERNSDGARLSQEQLQFFKDSKVRDEDGNLLTLYHGTSKADFNVFDISKSKNSGLLGLGFYFTDSLGEAERYSGKKGRVIQSYLNMKNPLYVDLTHKSAIIEKLRDIYSKKFADGEIKETFDVNYYLEDSHYKDRINTKKLLELIKKEGFDGIISKNKGYYVVFNSNQIKSTQNSEPTLSDDIRYSLSENVEEEVLDKFKTTYNWKETGYILQNGKRIDLSGRNDGAPGGYRTVDHRDVFDLSYYEEESGTNLMIEFMSRGNIRVIPEYPGINLQIEPTAEQYEQIRSLIDNVAWKEQQFIVDFDDKRGNTIDSMVYENNISARKIINDIKYYFKEGKVPYQSELSQFRYSLETDSDGNKLTENQVEFFKNSKVRDDGGNLQMVYHGTDTQFNVFDKSKNVEGNNAFWFSKSIDYAEEMAIVKNSNIVNKYYLNIKNPLFVKMNSKDFADNVKEEKFIKQAKAGNYDGVIFIEDITDGDIFYAVFSANQIKNTDNKSPTLKDDVRFSLEDGSKGYEQYSKGQIAKYIAEHSKAKAYSRTDAEQVVNTVVAQTLSFGTKYGEISNKTKQQVIDQLWHTYNTRKEGYGLNMLDDIAEFIINSAVVEDMLVSEAHDSDVEVASYTINMLSQYIRKVDLASLKGEIAYKYDDKQSKIYGRWGKRKGTSGQSPDQIAQELEEYGIRFRSNVPADILFEMNDMWESAMNDMRKIQKEKLTSLKEEIDLKELKTRIRDELLRQEDNVGHKTKFAETIEYYTSKISNLKKAVKDVKAFNKAKNNVISTIERLRDEFVKNKPAGWKVPQQVADFVKKIARVETWRNDISKNAREYIRELETSIDLVMDEQQQSIYPFRELIREIASGKGNLTTEEMTALDAMLRQFAWQLRNYDKVNFEGKSQSITEIATQGVHESKQAQKILKHNGNILNKFKNKVYTNPYERVAEMGLYRENSIMMRLFAEMKEGDRRRAAFVRDANLLFEEFYKNNKNYLSDLQREITIGKGENQITISKRQALSLYATSLREQGRNHLFNEGYDYGVVRLLDNKLSTQGKTLDAFAKGRDVNITQEMIEEIKKALTEVDKQYLELTTKFFNEMSRDAKAETDKKLYGITNIENGNYFPIKVSNDKIYTEAGQRNNDLNQYVLEMGMNKTTKPRASNKIVIDGIDNIVATHIKNMSMYYGYAIPLNAYNRIMNKAVLETEGADSSSNIRSEIMKIDTDFEKYMDKLWQDIQGISYSEKGFISNLLSKIRWAGANSALGANPKVLVTQTLSLASGMSEFNPKYIAKGMAHFFGEKHKADIAKYSSLMWERMQLGNSVDITDIRQIGKEIGSKAGKVGAKITKGLTNFTTKPISWMDSNVIQSLWFAAQYEVADTKGKGFEYGTEANKIEAGKRLDDVVFRTQQTSDALGRSEWMRSQNEIVKFARMFTGDAIQLTGKLISSVNKYNTARRMIKSGDAELVKSGEKLLSEAKVSLAKAGSSFMLNQVMLLAIAMAFKWIKGLGDDEEWDDVAKNELIANLMGLIPFGADVFDKLSGYEPTNMAYTALSDTIEIAEDLYNNTAALIKGEYQDPIKRNAAIRKTILSMSKLFGIPTQNLESYTKGIIGKISPATREQYEALYKTKSNAAYLKKLKKATEDGDEELANTIVNIMFDSRTGKISNDKVLNITRKLIEDGYDVIPRSVGQTITYNGTQYTLTSKQHTRFQKIYSQANESVASMVNSAVFNRLDDEAKAKAMNFIYDYYYDLAIEDLLGEDIDSKTMLFAEVIPIEQLAMAVSQARLYEADLDKKGKVISGTKKAKVQTFIQGLKLSAVQKYMIMGYLGYSNKYGDTLVKSYINRLNLTKDQKNELYSMSGYAA